MSVKSVVSGFSRTVIIAVALAVAGVVALRAQVAAPTFRAGTTLIEFSVVAMDEKGNPVTDLTQDDLILTEGGRSRDIAFFRFDGNLPPVSGAPGPALPAGFVTNQPQAERNVVAIVIDELNVDPTGKYGQTSVRGLLLTYLNSLPPNTRVGLFRFAELQPMETLQTFTDRLDLVRAKVSSMNPGLRTKFGEPGITPAFGGGSANAQSGMAAMRAAEAQQVGAINRGINDVRLARTLEALQALGSHLTGIPGRKSLLWITNAPPMQFKEGGERLSYEPQIRQAAQRLANQGIAVYPASTGLVAVKEDDPNDHSTFGIVSGVTGGRAVISTNDLTVGIKTAANDQRGTYTLGFYAADEPDDAWHPVQVTIKRAGVALRYRQGYLAMRRAQLQNWPSKNWNDVVYQPLDSTGIRLNARSDAGGGKVAVSLQIAASDLYFHEKDGQAIADLEIGLVEQTSKGPTNVRIQPTEVSLEAPLAGPRPDLVSVETTWALNPGTTTVRVIVRDRYTGRYGTLNVPLTRR